MAFEPLSYQGQRKLLARLVPNPYEYLKKFHRRLLLLLNLVWNLKELKRFSIGPQEKHHINHPVPPTPWICAFLLRPNKKISVFLVTGLKILGRVGTHIIF